MTNILLGKRIHTYFLSEALHMVEHENENLVAYILDLQQFILES